jgi:hypothetical protein
MKERREVIVKADGYVGDIVHAGTFEVPVREEKAKWAYKMKGSACSGAKAGNVAGVLGYLGFDEDDFEVMPGKNHLTDFM